MLNFQINIRFHESGKNFSFTNNRTIERLLAKYVSVFRLKIGNKSINSHHLTTLSINNLEVTK